MKKGENKAVADTVRKLKSAQSGKTATSSVQEKESSAKRKPAKRTIPRGGNIFKRM